LLQAGASHGLILKVNLPSPGPTVKANTNQIQQMLTNLVTNAWEAVGEKQGTVTLTVKTVPQTDISEVHRYPTDWQTENAAYACLEVTDTGCGIAGEAIDKIFDPFYSTKFTGRGLGLPVVFGIVKAHDGVITVASKEHGSTFRVFLPLSAEKIPRQPGKSTQPFARDGSGTVLLIEDELMLRDMAKAMIMHLGYTVLAAKDGIEALEMFARHQDEIRCVVSDVTMPRMNGWETLAALRKLSPGIPVIFSSGYDEAQVLIDDHPERPQAFLHKPYQMVELQAALAKAMED
jgi:CheY-like chemotaxis protein